jgi:GNAT superfamily N-acetyltransferase
MAGAPAGTTWTRVGDHPDAAQRRRRGSWADERPLGTHHGPPQGDAMPTTPALTPHDVQLIEQAEAQYFHRFFDRVPEATRQALGVRTARIGDGLAVAMEPDPSRLWTKALGFGFDVPVDDALITEVTGFFRSAGKATGTLAISPSVLPHDWERIAADHGITAGPAWAKHACPVADFVPGSSDLPIRRLGPDDLAGWSRLIPLAFGLVDPDLTPMLAATLEDPVARVFGAFDGDLLVGAGIVHLLGEVASINTGSTLPSHRGRGVQSGLLAARAAAAAEAGVRLLATETGPAEGNPSYRNVARAGFTHHYDRTNWRWAA